MCCFYRHYPVLPKSDPEDTRFFVCHIKKSCGAYEALRQPNVIPKMKTKVGGKRPFLSILGQTSQEGTDRGLTSPPTHTHTHKDRKKHIFNEKTFLNGGEDGMLTTTDD